MLKNYSIKKLRGTTVQTNDNENNRTPGRQKMFTDQSYKTAKSKNDTEKLVFRDILQKTEYYKCLPTKSCMSVCDRYNKNDLDKEVRRSSNLDTKHKGRGIEKNIIPSDIFDIYTRLENLLGLKLSGHTDALTEASFLIKEI